MGGGTTVLFGGIIAEAAPGVIRSGREIVGTLAGIMPGTTCSKARLRTGIICSLIKSIYIISIFLNSFESEMVWEIGWGEGFTWCTEYWSTSCSAALCTSLSTLEVSSGSWLAQGLPPMPHTFPSQTAVVGL